MAEIKKYASITSLQSLIDNIKLKFATLVHTHKLSDITDYKVDNELSSTSTNPIQNKVVNEEFDTVAQAMNTLQNYVNTKADSTTVANTYETKTDATAKKEALEATLDTKVDNTDTISNDEIDEICNETMVNYLNSIAAEEVSF